MFQKTDAKYDIGVIGAGISGLLAALEAADAGKTVAVFERLPELYKGASGINPGRMGLGFHYADLETSIQYLEATVAFIRDSEEQGLDFRLGSSTRLHGSKPLPTDHKQRKGLYMVPTADSKPVMAPKELLLHYSRIADHYRDMCKTDPRNKVFGEPEDFYELLDFDELQSMHGDKLLGSKHRIHAGIRTPEELMDVQGFSEHIVRRVTEHPKIQIMMNTEVSGLDYGQDGLSYVVNVKRGAMTVGYPVGQVLNASWADTDKLNETLGIPMEDKGRTNRLKLLAKIKLPESLKDAPCMFFAIGPFCMFSNMQDGYGMLTYAPVTNHINSTDLALSQDAQRKMYEGLTKKEIEKFGKLIIDGVTEFIPAMKDATIDDVKAGVVKTVGANADIHDPNSEIHKRRELGRRELAVGLQEISSMKLLYGPINAKNAMRFIERSDSARKNQEGLVNAFDASKSVSSAASASVFSRYLQRNTTLDELLDEKRENAAAGKIAHNAELLSVAAPEKPAAVQTDILAIEGRLTRLALVHVHSYIRPDSDELDYTDGTASTGSHSRTDSPSPERSDPAKKPPVVVPEGPGTKMLSVIRYRAAESKSRRGSNAPSNAPSNASIPAIDEAPTPPKGSPVFGKPKAIRS